MRHERTSLSFFLIAFIFPSAATTCAQEDSGPPPEFQRAYKLAQSKQYDEALQILDDVLKQESNTRNALFSAGSIALMAGRYERARTYLLRMKELEPHSGRVRAALVRADQGIGDLAARDRERGGLFALRSSGDDPEMKTEDSYVRDEFVVEGSRVVAVEFFELEGDRALRYSFLVFNSGHEHPDYRISLGSYIATNAVWRATKKPTPKPEERVFHLDGYYADGSHATFGIHYPEPSYDAVREMIVKIVQQEAVDVQKRR